MDIFYLLLMVALLASIVGLVKGCAALEGKK